MSLQWALGMVLLEDGKGAALGIALTDWDVSLGPVTPSRVRGSAGDWVPAVAMPLAVGIDGTEPTVSIVIVVAKVDAGSTGGSRFNHTLQI